MRVFLSIVSHGHSNLIHKLGCVRKLISDFEIVVKSNKPGDNFSKLDQSENFHWVDEHYFCGFGHNNNIVFNYCQSRLGMNRKDYFVVLNPDVVIDAFNIRALIKKMESNKIKLSSINLYKDFDYTVHDNSIRNFPTLKHFAKSFLGLENDAVINKDTIADVTQVDWAAGSFLAFQSSHYAKLGGFDENYFMYCEDIDICYRSMKLGHYVNYHPDIKAIHLASHANRNLFSKHFIWHVTSAIRFLFTRLGLNLMQSSIKN